MTTFFLLVLFGVGFFGMPIGILLALVCMLAVIDKKARSDPWALRMSSIGLVVNFLACWVSLELRENVFFVLAILALVGSGVALVLCLRAWYVPHS